MVWTPHSFQVEMPRLLGQCRGMESRLREIGLSRGVGAGARLGDLWGVQTFRREESCSISSPWLTTEDWPELLELLWWLEFHRIQPDYSNPLRVLLNGISPTGAVGIADTVAVFGSWYLHEPLLRRAGNMEHTGHLQFYSDTEYHLVAEELANLRSPRMGREDISVLWYDSTNTYFGCDLWPATTSRYDVLAWVTLFRAAVQRWATRALRSAHEADNPLAMITGWLEAELTTTTLRGRRQALEIAVADCTDGHHRVLTLEFLRRRYRV